MDPNSRVRTRLCPTRPTVIQAASCSRARPTSVSAGWPCRTTPSTVMSPVAESRARTGSSTRSCAAATSRALSIERRSLSSFVVTA
ncbi:hypothetical protein U6N30_01330 [Blastococcus brunescens]|uniref:Uncharacterized protein n=1 Tax=Blastococcus brunescens TaxID=1564165 RepID=A0ABZ1B117_9ACTN|nr:hypothetical protein [Blastococcus sp. BMG 8361]WRL64509.1 hypothetical protein U6N30_01330 [Blastococcus sp. BMG 8361]